MKCTRCGGLGGGYETCEGTYPELVYDYVEIGDCTKCNGYGEVCNVCEDEIFKDSVGKWKMRIENSNWDDHNDCLDYNDIEINFCYQCGKKFE